MKTLVVTALAVLLLAAQVNAHLRANQQLESSSSSLTVELDRGIPFDFYPDKEDGLILEVNDELGIACTLEKSRDHHAVSCNYIDPDRYGQIAWFWRSPAEWYPLSVNRFQFRNTDDGRGVVLIVDTSSHLIFLNGTFGWLMHRIPRNQGFIHSLSEAPLVKGNLYWIEGSSPDGSGAKQATHVRVLNIHTGSLTSVALPLTQEYYCKGHSSQERCILQYQWQPEKPGMILLSNETVSIMWNAITQSTSWGLDAGASQACIYGNAIVFSGYKDFKIKVFKLSDIPSGTGPTNPASISPAYTADLSGVDSNSYGFNGCKYLDVDLTTEKLSISWWFSHRYPDHGINAYTKANNYFVTYDLKNQRLESATLFSTASVNMLFVQNGTAGTYPAQPPQSSTSNVWAVWAGKQYTVFTFPGFRVLHNATLPFSFNKDATETPAEVYLLPNSNGAQLVNIAEGDTTNPEMYITNFMTNEVYFHKELNSRYESGAVYAPWPNNRFAILSNNASTIEIYKYY